MSDTKVMYDLKDAVSEATPSLELNPILKLTKDLKIASKTLSDTEARFLVDAYYTMQEDRKRAHNQVRSLEKAAEPHAVLDWLAAQSGGLEKEILAALDVYGMSKVVGRWMRAQVGIGAVITAGLLAHIDITRAPTVGHIYGFCGYNPTIKWGKGQKRPWNADLKKLCWHIGESFVKTSGHERSFYGKLYTQRKLEETRRNEAGEFKDQAAQALSAKKYVGDTTAKKCYLEGKLPPAHIHSRAKRWAVKIFLSHLHAVWYYVEFGKAAAHPYAFDVLQHSHKHYLQVPLIEQIPELQGFRELEINPN